MPITFEQVSYTYENIAQAKKDKRRQKRRKTHAHATAEDTKAHLTRETPSANWGQDPSALWALRDIDFTLNEGEFLGIAGHTGSGKSTLIQHMNGLLQPSSGRVYVDGQDISHKSAARGAREKVGMVFQYPEHQLFGATVYDDVAFGPRNMKLSADEVDTRVKQALENVGLDFKSVRDKSPFELSGGQQRRVAFAGILAMSPRVLVLDEPTAGLDPKSHAEILSLVQGLHKSGLSVVMVSHNMDDLAALADRILILNKGAQYMIGTPEEVFSDEEILRSVGLALPAAQRLSHRLKARGVDLKSDFYDEVRLKDELSALYEARDDVASRKVYPHFAHGTSHADSPTLGGAPHAG